MGRDFLLEFLQSRQIDFGLLPRLDRANGFGKENGFLGLVALRWISFDQAIR